VSASLAFGLLLTVTGLVCLAFAFYALSRGGKDQKGGIGPISERGIHVIAGIRMLAVGTLSLAAGVYLLLS
jgi:hypothetical protein